MAVWPAVYIQGARQVGKSTLVRELGHARGRYITLDDPTAMVAATSDPDQFIAGLPDGAIIDEFQHVPALARAVKRAIDGDRRPGRFLLTGSASVMAVPELAKELVGRVCLMTLWPFTQGELAGRRDAFVRTIFRELPKAFGDSSCSSSAVVKRTLRGGYPGLPADASTRQIEAYFQSYVATLLQRDVRDIAQVHDIAGTSRLLRLLAQRASRIFNYSDLSRTLAMPQTTLKRHVAILMAMFLFSEVPAWFTNKEKRFAKASKLLMGDTGLACALQGLDLPGMETNPEAAASLIENLVGVELAKQISLDLPMGRLLHFRIHAGAEVDWVVEDAAGRVVGVEVKSGSSVRAGDLVGLKTLQELAGDRFAGGVVLYCGSESYMAGERLCVAPLSALWGWEQ